MLCPDGSLCISLVCSVDDSCVLSSMDGVPSEWMLDKHKCTNITSMMLLISVDHYKIQRGYGSNIIDMKEPWYQLNVELLVTVNIKIVAKSTLDHP